MSGRRLARLLVIVAGALTATALTVTALTAGSALAAPLTGHSGADATVHTQDGGTGPAPELLIAAENPVIAPGGTELRFELIIRNPGEDPVAPGTVRLTLDTQRVTDPTQLGEAGNSGVDFAEVSAAQTGAAGEQRLTVTVPEAELPLAETAEPGVYVVTANFLPEETDAADAAEIEHPHLTAHTPLVWQGTGIAPAAVTLVVPLVLPRSVATMPTPEEIAALAPRWDRLLTAAEVAQATLAIDPRIIAGIRGYGLASSAVARQFLDRLAASPLPMFLLQFADADPAAEAAVGLEELLRPSGLSFVTQWGRFEAQPDQEPEQTAEPEPEQTVEPGTTPTLDELLTWPQGRSGAWPAAGEVDSTTIDLLRRSGIDSVILDSSNAEVTGGTRFALDGLDALVADSALGAAAQRALAGADQVERLAGRAELAARTALTAQSELPSTVLALDRGAIGEATNPEVLIAWLTSLDWITPVFEDEQPAASGSLISGGTSEQRRELLRENLKVSEDITALAPLLEHPEYLQEYQRVRLLQAFATREAPTGVDFAAVTEQRRERDAELLLGVEIVTTANTQLVGTSSQVPVQLHNSLPFTALVSLHISPTSAGVAVPERLFAREEVSPGGNATVLVPVRSRVSSGESALLAQVTDADGERVFNTATLPLTIRSAFETILLWGLASFALVLLALGIWRSVRRRRHAAE